MNNQELYVRKIDLILKWAPSTPTFNSAFVVSLFKYTQEGKILSDSQKNAIDNIILNWCIDEANIDEQDLEDEKSADGKIVPIFKKNQAPHIDPPADYDQLYREFLLEQIQKLRERDKIFDDYFKENFKGFINV